MFGASANSADPDQTPPYVASGQGLHCLLPGYFMSQLFHVCKANIEYKLPKINTMYRIRSIYRTCSNKHTPSSFLKYMCTKAPKISGMGRQRLGKIKNYFHLSHILRY